MITRGEYCFISIKYSCTSQVVHQHVIRIPRTLASDINIVLYVKSESWLLLPVLLATATHMSSVTVSVNSLPKPKAWEGG